MANSEKIVLGSGKLYIAPYTDGDAIPDDATIETDDNLLGYIQGGASIKYEPTFYDVEDDLGYVKETFLTKEDVTLSSGILTWDGVTLQKLCSTARVSTSTDGRTRTVKIGGINNFENKAYIIRFVHANNGTRTTIVGSNKAGFEFAYAPDKETVVNVEFKAKSQDTEGTLITYTEQIETTP